MMKKIFFVFVYSVFFLFLVPAQTDLERGVGYLKNNQAEKALPFFFSEVQNPQGNTKAYLYLSVACMQLQKYSDAIIWLKKGKELDLTDTYLYSYNLGNAYYMQGAYEMAVDTYQVAVSENPFYAPTFLNKANAEMKMGKFDEALVSYKQYLSLEPSTPQRSSIERMIGILQGEQDAKRAEILRLQAEEKAREEREKALLDAVNNNLSTSDSAKTLSAGSEDTIDYTEEEGDLE